MGRKSSKYSSIDFPIRTLEDDIVLAMNIGIPLPLIADAFGLHPAKVRKIYEKSPKRKRGGRRKVMRKLWVAVEPHHDVVGDDLDENKY